MTILDLVRERAAQRPAAPALVVDRGDGGSDVVPYGVLVRRFEEHAAELRAGGVRPGDRCGLQARQGPGFVEWALGVLAAGACVAPIPDDHRGRALDALVRRARLHHVVAETDAGFALGPRDDAGAVDGAGDRDFRALRPAYLRFTSGTTSQRKGVVLGHDAILARTAAANRALAIGPGDRVLWLLPMAHHFVVSILLYLREGASLLLPASPLARPILDFAAREGATVLYASPNHVRTLAGDASPQPLPALRLAVSTADGLRRDVALAFARRFGQPVAQALGIIEVGLPVANVGNAAGKPESVGRPLPDYEVWLRGEDGRRVEGPASPEGSGEVCIRGPGLLDAYLDPWLPAREILEDGAFRTGDQGFFDADGDLVLCGRRTNRISMAGMKFFAEEVEEVLDRHPAVAESRVRAREHAKLGEIPVADVVPADPAAPPSAAALAGHCREWLPAYKIPRAFEIVAEIARTSSGKVLRGDATPASRDRA